MKSLEEKKCQIMYWNLIESLDNFYNNINNNNNFNSTMYVRELLMTEECDNINNLFSNRYAYIYLMKDNRIDRIKNYSSTFLDKQIATTSMSIFGKSDYIKLVSGLDWSNWIYYKIVYQPKNMLKFFFKTSV